MGEWSAAGAAFITLIGQVWLATMLPDPFMAHHLMINPAEAAAKEKVLHLWQTHYFTGDNELFVGKEALRIENKGRFGFILVSRAPNWDITIFRNDDHVYFSESLTRFENSGMLSDILFTQRDRNLTKARPAVDFLFKGMPAKRKRNYDQVVEYFPIRNLTAPQVERILFAAFKVQTEGGILIRNVDTQSGKDWMTGMDQTGKQRILLKTANAAYEQISSAQFDPPKSYRRVSTVQEAVVGDRDRKNSEAFGVMFDRKRQ